MQIYTLRKENDELKLKQVWVVWSEAYDLIGIYISEEVAKRKVELMQEEEGQWFEIESIEVEEEP